jgi:hypothetical protein
MSPQQQQQQQQVMAVTTGALIPGNQLLGSCSTLDSPPRNDALQLKETMSNFAIIDVC